MCRCGVETIAAFTPGGRIVDLEFDHVWVRPDEPWPIGIFILGISGREKAIAHATPALAAVDATPSKPAGPFRREHFCEAAA